MKRYFLFIAILLGFSSCFEIIEELDLKKDDSGTLTYTINLSQSKMEMSSVLKLDSVKGVKIPSKYEIREVMNSVRDELSYCNGITSVSFEDNWEDYVFVFKVGFDSLSQLTAALEKTYKKLSNHKTPLLDKIEWSGDTLSRTSKLGTLSLFRRLDEKYIAGLDKAFYTCVYRFDKPIQKSENKRARISKSGKAILLRSNVKNILNKDISLENKITFTG